MGFDRKDLENQINELFSSSERTESLESIESITGIIKNSEKIIGKSLQKNKIMPFDSEKDFTSEGVFLKENSSKNFKEVKNEDMHYENISACVKIHAEEVSFSSFKREYGTFTEFLNNFEVVGKMFKPKKFYNDFKNYGILNKKERFFYEWEILHLFDRNLETSLKNLPEIRSKILEFEVQKTNLTFNLKNKENESEEYIFSYSHTESFYKAFFEIKKKYNIINNKIYFRTKHFKLEDEKGIPIKFVDFNLPENFPMEDKIFVILNEKEFVCVFSENVSLSKETPEMFLKNK